MKRHMFSAPCQLRSLMTVRTGLCQVWNIATENWCLCCFQITSARNHKTFESSRSHVTFGIKFKMSNQYFCFSKSTTYKVRAIGGQHSFWFSDQIVVSPNNKNFYKYFPIAQHTYWYRKVTPVQNGIL